MGHQLESIVGAPTSPVAHYPYLALAGKSWLAVRKVVSKSAKLNQTYTLIKRNVRNDGIRKDSTVKE
jgi:hypothetical protein